MKRFLKVISALIGLTIWMSVSGCGLNRTTPMPSESSTAKEPKQVRMRFSWVGGDARHQATLKAMDAYMARTPNVIIEGEYGGFVGWSEKLMTQFAAGTAPDVMQIDPGWVYQLFSVQDQMVDFYKQDVIDLNIFQGNELLYEKIVSGNGKLMGVPAGVNTMCLFGNKKVFDEVGIDSSKPFTWDRLFEEAKKVHAHDSNMYLMSTPFPGRYIFGLYLLNQSGDYLIKNDYSLGFTEEQAARSFAFVQRLYDEKVLQPLDQIIGVVNDIEMPGWIDNKIAMFPNNPGTTWSSVQKSIGKENMLILPPLGDVTAKNTSVMMRASVFFGALQSEKTPQALDFINFLITDPEAHSILGIQRSLPVNQKQFEYVTRNNLLPDGFMDVIKYCKENKGGQGYNVLSDDVYYETIEKELIAKVYYGESTPESAAKEFVNTVEKYVADLKAAKW